jgi:uncharacterized cupin superfamily protein
MEASRYRLRNKGKVLFDVPGGAERGGHAHKSLHELIIALSGSFDVILDDGTQKNAFI